MSALPPIADINPHRLECLLLAKSGHWLVSYYQYQMVTVVVSLSAQIFRNFLYLLACQSQSQRSHEARLTIVADTVANIDGLVDQIGFVLTGEDWIAVPDRYISVDAMTDGTLVLAIKGLTIERLIWCLCDGKLP